MFILTFPILGNPLYKNRKDMKDLCPPKIHILFGNVCVTVKGSQQVFIFYHLPPESQQCPRCH
jgi:hypothetical protein